MITYHQLRTFLLVVRTGRLTKAERELNVSAQPGALTPLDLGPIRIPARRC